MAKILVADDNSNIQKMVGLALKDQGIDVVAVGNGEAAVRKISDVRPDLVLADVFMPVRNGYEVCNYVKKDSALSHIPVILLVGAFDPLDEQEAQRVGADGVLKKPFVPPDPLISMVKSALTRAGVVLGASDAAPAASPAPAANAKPQPLTLPRIAPSVAPPAPEPEIDLGTPVFSSRPAPLTIAKGEQPLAFGTLLDAPAQEEEPVFTSSSGGAIAPDRDWGHQAVAEEPEEEEDSSSQASWRSNAIDELPNETPAGQTDWREAAFSGIGDSSKAWAPSVEKNSLSITEEEAAEIARKGQPVPPETVGRAPEDWSKAIDAVFSDPLPVPVASAAPSASEPAWPAASSYSSPAPATFSEPQFTAPDSPSEPPSAPVESASQVAESAPAPESSATAESSAQNSPGLNSWMAGAVSPWDSELSKASDLASSWDSLKLPVPAIAADTEATQAFLDSGLMASAHEHVVEAVEEAKAESLVSSEPTSTETDSIERLYSPEDHSNHQELDSVAPEISAYAPESPASAEPAVVVPETSAQPAASPSSTNTNMDELVAKVLAKMNPDVLQAVTREILKPVIEALVKDELNKK